MNRALYTLAAAAIASGGVLRADLKRRRLSLRSAAGWRLLSALDILSPTVTVIVVAGLAVNLLPSAISEGVVPLRSPLTWGVVSGTLIFLFLWGEGRRQIQFQRPKGILFAEWLILVAANQILATTLFGSFLFLPRGLTTNIVSALAGICGVVLIAVLVPPFTKKGAEYHRILSHLVDEGESIQSEYTPPTPECPNPKLWNMVDSQTTELEVLDFLKSLVTTLKPKLILETGTFLGYGAIKLGEGVKERMGSGKLSQWNTIQRSSPRRLSALRQRDWRTGSIATMSLVSIAELRERLTFTLATARWRSGNKRSGAFCRKSIRADSSRFTMPVRIFRRSVRRRCEWNKRGCFRSCFFRLLAAWCWRKGERVVSDRALRIQFRMH